MYTYADGEWTANDGAEVNTSTVTWWSNAAWACSGADDRPGEAGQIHRYLAGLDDGHSR